ncbi:hypothetical protein EDC04DRAFT_2614545 [Pisolithus marmoratus]|nr:hypothetical protein EDC04DRAFT_2614545 [Pisolithus marmoratus]
MLENCHQFTNSVSLCLQEFFYHLQEPTITALQVFTSKKYPQSPKVILYLSKVHHPPIHLPRIATLIIWIEVAENPTLELDSINWNNVNTELEAAMNESEDDDNVESVHDSLKSGVMMDDKMGTNDSHSQIRAVLALMLGTSSSPQLEHKCLQSVTPSDNGSGLTDQQDLLQGRLREFGDSSFNIAQASTLMDAWCIQLQAVQT